MVDRSPARGRPDRHGRARHRSSHPRSLHRALLMEESITSSQLEGAATTRRVAKELLRSGQRATQTRASAMIWNNYQAMNFIRTHQCEYLTPGTRARAPRSRHCSTRWTIRGRGPIQDSGRPPSPHRRTRRRNPPQPPPAEELAGAAASSVRIRQRHCGREGLGCSPFCERSRCTS